MVDTGNHGTGQWGLLILWEKTLSVNLLLSLRVYLLHSRYNTRLPSVYLSVCDVQVVKRTLGVRTS